MGIKCPIPRRVDTPTRAMPGAGRSGNIHDLRGVVYWLNIRCAWPGCTPLASCQQKFQNIFAPNTITQAGRCARLHKPCLILHKSCIQRPSDGACSLIYVLSIGWRVENNILHFQRRLLPPSALPRSHQHDGRYVPVPGPGLDLIQQCKQQSHTHHPAMPPTLHQKPATAFFHHRYIHDDPDPERLSQRLPEARKAMVFRCFLRMKWCFIYFSTKVEG